MATVVVNRPDLIEFKNASPAGDAPTLNIQAGDWEIDGHAESGIVFDVSGDQLPILAATDARKLAKWLNRAADELEGKKKSNKKPRYHVQEDDEDTYGY